MISRFLVLFFPVLALAFTSYGQLSTTGKEFWVGFMENNRSTGNQNTPDFLTHIKKMDELGFIPYDIVDQHRYKETLLFQIDICFINKTTKSIIFLLKN